MKRCVLLVLILGSVITPLIAQTPFENRPLPHGLTMPTGSVLNHREAIVGLGYVAFGVTDRCQVGTDLLAIFFKTYGVDLKYAAIKNDSSSLSVGLNVRFFYMNVIGTENHFLSTSPFLAYTKKVGQYTRLHIGGMFSFFTGNEDVQDADVESSIVGSSFYIGTEHDLTPRIKFLTEAGYDLTFKGSRIGGGFLFGWTKFRLKLGAQYYNPDGPADFVNYVIGLWWRFPDK